MKCTLKEYRVLLFVISLGQMRADESDDASFMSKAKKAKEILESAIIESEKQRKGNK